MKPFILFLLTIGMMSLSMADVLQDQLAVYRAQGASDFSAERGEAMWKKEYHSAKTGKLHSCGSCHGQNLTTQGKHIKTGKLIEPIALSVNQKRFTDGKKIEKWFKRNCRWTLGRLCSPQEKGDFLVFLSQQ